MATITRSIKTAKILIHNNAATADFWIGTTKFSNLQQGHYVFEVDPNIVDIIQYDDTKTTIVELPSSINIIPNMVI